MSGVIAYTDGGCRGNPGVGGWAFLLVDSQTGKALERADGDPHTTNNRMEMLAAINCLHALKKAGTPVCIHSDSKYLIDCCSKWMPGWKAAGWKRKGGPLKNLDLLQELDALLQTYRVRWQWVKGHAGNPGNERVDTLANQVMDAIQAGTSAAYEKRRKWP
jgi:ribonuclease HI